MGVLFIARPFLSHLVHVSAVSRKALGRGRLSEEPTTTQALVANDLTRHTYVIEPESTYFPSHFISNINPWVRPSKVGNWGLERFSHIHTDGKVPGLLSANSVFFPITRSPPTPVSVCQKDTGRAKLWDLEACAKVWNECWVLCKLRTRGASNEKEGQERGKEKCCVTI